MADDFNKNTEEFLNALDNVTHELLAVGVAKKFADPIIENMNLMCEEAPHLAVCKVMIYERLIAILECEKNRISRDVNVVDE